MHTQTDKKGKNGLMAEWLGRGLQNLVQRFESASDLQNSDKRLIFISRFFCIHKRLQANSDLVLVSNPPLYKGRSEADLNARVKKKTAQKRSYIICLKPLICRVYRAGERRFHHSSPAQLIVQPTARPPFSIRPCRDQPQDYR